MLGSAIAAMAETMMLDVTIAYRERIALPPDAEVDVQLLDVSRMDVAAVQLSGQRFKMTGVPFSVTLPYDPALIDERMTYTVAARLFSGGEVIFRTTQAFPVLTRGSGTSVELVLERMPASAPAAPGTAVAVSDVVWQAFEIGGRMLIAEDPPTLQIQPDGMFSAYGGCNRFRGQVEVGAGTIAFPDAMAGTRMACPPPRARLETQMLEALKSSTGFVRNETSLVLTNTAGVATVRFRAEPTQP
jgi:putative lipoprotein